MRKIQQSRFKPSGHFARRYEMVVEHGVTLEDIKNPTFYAHVAFALKPYDIITVMSDDQSFYAEVYVLSAERTAAAVTILRSYDLNVAEKVDILSSAAKPDDFEIKFRGPVGKHSVVRKADGSVIREGLGTKAEAEQALRDYLKVLAA